MRIEKKRGRKRKRGKVMQEAALVHDAADSALDLLLDEARSSCSSDGDGRGSVHDDSVGQSLCIPQQIMEERVVRNQKQYRIKWVDFPSKKDWSWQKASDFDRDPDFAPLIEDWVARAPKK